MVAVSMEQERIMASSSRLIEESAASDAGLVLRSDIDVARAQQENLAGHPLDGSAQAKDEASSEIDETFSVCIVHLSEVHDDRNTFAELLTDGPRLVVVARVDGQDAVNVSDARLLKFRTATVLNRLVPPTVLLIGIVMMQLGHLRRWLIPVVGVDLRGELLVGKILLVVPTIVNDPDVRGNLPADSCHLELLLVGLSPGGVLTIQACH